MCFPIISALRTLSFTKNLPDKFGVSTANSFRFPLTEEITRAFMLDRVIYRVLRDSEVTYAEDRMFCVHCLYLEYIKSGYQS